MLNKFRNIQNNTMTTFQKIYEKPHFSPSFGTFPTFYREPDISQKIRLRHIFLAIIL